MFDIWYSHHRVCLSIENDTCQEALLCAVGIQQFGSGIVLTVQTALFLILHSRPARWTNKSLKYRKYTEQKSFRLVRIPLWECVSGLPQYEATKAYMPKELDELGLQQAELVIVLRKEEGEDLCLRLAPSLPVTRHQIQNLKGNLNCLLFLAWCYGERMRDGERGWFPASCATEITNPTAMESNVQRMKRLRKETNVWVTLNGRSLWMYRMTETPSGRFATLVCWVFVEAALLVNHTEHKKTINFCNYWSRSPLPPDWKMFTRIWKASKWPLMLSWCPSGRRRFESSRCHVALYCQTVQTSYFKTWQSG